MKNNFWMIVNEIQLATRHDYTFGKKYLLKNHKNEIEEIRKTFDHFYNQLAVVLEKHNKLYSYGLGDDSFSDLIAECIGRGEMFFNLVLKNPMIAYHMAHGGFHKFAWGRCSRVRGKNP